VCRDIAELVGLESAFGVWSFLATDLEGEVECLF